MIVGIIIGSAVLVIALMIGSFYFFGQKFVLQLMRLNSNQRKDNKEEIESGVKGILDGNQQLFAQAIKDLEKQLTANRKEAGDLKTQNAAIKELLQINAEVTKGLQVSTESLKNLLSNNRLRGDWGEQIAEDLLQGAGFVQDVNYLKQATMANGRPDFTILLPDGYKLNVDAKFPFDDLITYQEAKTAEDKRKALSGFRSTIRQKIKDISSRDYINPEEQTVDFVIMFIPNEMIFSFIYEKISDINHYANKQKVILAGPFGFTAVLRLVLQAHKNFHHERSLIQILGLISKFQEEYERFGSTLDKLGKQIDTTKNTFIEVEGTRSRQLTRIVRQIGERSEAGVPTQNQLEQD